MRTLPPELDRPATPDPEAAHPTGTRRTALLVWAAVGLIVIGVGAVLLLRGDTAIDPPGAPPGTVRPLETTADGGLTDVAWFGFEPLTRTGDGLLLVGDGMVARYHDGGWWAYPTPPPACCADAALGADGTVFVSMRMWPAGSHPAAADRRPHEVFQLVEGEWRPLVGHPADPWWIATDPASGVLWVSNLDRLWSWDGEVWTAAPEAPTSRLEGVGSDAPSRIDVDADGSVWSWGGTPFSSAGALARFDPATETWEYLRPWPGHGEVPAPAVAFGPNGDVWAVLADVERRDGEAPTGTALANLDTDTGEWRVHELPDLEWTWLARILASRRPALAVDDNGVWLTEGFVGAASSGIAHFDGDRWQQHLDGVTVADIEIDDDGGIWIAIGDRVLPTKIGDIELFDPGDR